MNNELINADNNIQLFSLNGHEYQAKIVDLYDGDTCKIVILFNNKLTKFTCRLKGIDAPEIKPKKNMLFREEHIKKAITARNYLLNVICDNKCDDINISKKEILKLLSNNKKLLKIKCYEFDKYGRLLIDVYDNDLLINEELIKLGLVKSYDGGTKDI
jgi:endonuclease YncB( thermonuclease family)